MLNPVVVVVVVVVALFVAVSKTAVSSLDWINLPQNSTRVFKLNCFNATYKISLWSVKKCARKRRQQVLLCTDLVTPSQGQRH